MIASVNGSAEGYVLMIASVNGSAPRLKSEIAVFALVLACSHLALSNRMK